MRTISIALLALMLWSYTASSEPQKFIQGSLQQIEQSYNQQPFLLVLWSIDCPPCLKELELLKKTKDAFSNFNLALISTDPLSELQVVNALLTKYDLQAEDNWIFAEDFIEKLRFEIDPQWAGTLPQAYFYQADHQRISVAGTLRAEQLKRWALQQ